MTSLAVPAVGLTARATSGRAALLLGLLAAVLTVIAGCPTPASSNNSGVDTSTNDMFAGAAGVTLDGSGKADFSARIASDGDFDLFDIGEIEIGRRIVIDVTAASSNLDLVLALFDADESVYAFNDDRTESNLNPRLDVPLRAPTRRYFVGVAPFPGTGATGDYTVSVEVGSSDDAGPQAQTVFLNWSGGQNVTLRNIGTFNINPFSASDVGFGAGQTESIKRGVEAGVAARYAGYALTLLNSDASPPPAAAHSTVYFGGTNPAAFGISEQIDTLNQDPSDSAIIFTPSFRGTRTFAVTPTLQAMITALSNTSAHEIGHLLGMVHTNECTNLMDTRCGNDSLLVAQSFNIGVLDSTVFPVGNENTASLLEWTIGLAP